MIVVDANILIYAINEDSARHGEARDWIDRVLGGADTVGLAWVVMLAFIRLTTSSRVFPNPLSTDEAIDHIDDWLRRPAAVVVGPGDGHSVVLRSLLAAAGTGGNLTSDAHLAAVAIEHGAAVASYDHDFSRFEGVELRVPEG